MAEVTETLTTPEALRNYVHRTLCRYDSLEPAQSPLRSTLLTRGTRPCGVIFHVEGPRRLRTSAVWAADDAKILFYDSTGRRMTSVLVADGPDPAHFSELRPVARRAA